MTGCRNVSLTSARSASPAKDQLCQARMPTVHPLPCQTTTPVGPAPHFPAPAAHRLRWAAKNWPGSQGEAIECSAWRKIKSLRCVAQTRLRAGAGEEAALAKHYGKDCSRDHIPIGIERNRHYRLDVYEPL